MNGVRSLSIFNSDMKRFAIDILIFALAAVVVLAIACLALPGTRAKNSMLAHQIWIEKTLQETPGGRIIFVGGSGCGNGFCSDMIANAFKRNVVNTGLHAGLGLIYQMKAVERGVKRGDCVIVVPEYANFNGEACWGDLELLSMVLDIIPSDRSLISLRHWFHLLQFVPAYATSKMVGLFKGKVCEYKPRTSPYGDSGWGQLSRDARITFPSASILMAEAYRGDAVDQLMLFKRNCENIGVRVFVCPPAYQRTSFERQKDYIQRVSRELEQAGVSFIAPPEKFALPDDLYFDTPYHLNLSGRRIRSELMMRVVGALILAK